MNPENRSVPLAVLARDVEPNKVASILPSPLSQRLQGRQKRRLGDVFGLVNFGVNLTQLAPGAISALLHCHARQDEWVFILEGSPTLITTARRTRLEPGMCAGFRAGNGVAHQLHNETAQDVWYLEVGDRTPDDVATYPDDDLLGRLTATGWIFTHKDGSPYR